MKVRMIEPIGQRIHLWYEGKPHIYLKKIYPIDTEMEDVRKDVDWNLFNKALGKLVGWWLDIIYNTPSRKPEPGDMFWVHLEYQNYNWDNFEGDELHVILPNGIEWNIDSRAINCDMKEEKTHRCWVRTGTPPNVTISKNGNTCHAGAGSIQAGNYHGFLRNGELTSC